MYCAAWEEICIFPVVFHGELVFLWNLPRSASLSHPFHYLLMLYSVFLPPSRLIVKFWTNTLQPHSLLCLVCFISCFLLFIILFCIGRNFAQSFSSYGVYYFGMCVLDKRDKMTPNIQSLFLFEFYFLIIFCYTAVFSTTPEQLGFRLKL